MTELKEDIENIEAFVIKFTIANGYVPTKKDIISGTGVKKFRADTALSMSKNLFFIPFTHGLGLKVSGTVLDAIMQHYMNSTEQGEYFDKFINALRENIAYDSSK